MSGGRIPYQQARAAAECFVANVAPWCERVEIAGSLRRLHSEWADAVPEDRTVGDIEIVAIPTPALSARLALWKRWHEVADAAKRDGERYKKLALETGDDYLPCDLFLTEQERWGYIYALRTGPSETNQWWARPTWQGGARPETIKLDGGRVWRRATTPNLLGEEVETWDQIAVPSESKFFAAMEIPPLPPHERTIENMRGAAR